MGQIHSGNVEATPYGNPPRSPPIATIRRGPFPGGSRSRPPHIGKDVRRALPPRVDVTRELGSTGRGELSEDSLFLQTLGWSEEVNP